MTMPNGNLIEPRFRQSLDRWVTHAIPTGGFLEAVLCNDLREAVGRGDSGAIDNLPHIVSYLYNDCPHACWGSVANVTAWRGLRQSEPTDNLAAKEE